MKMELNRMEDRSRSIQIEQEVVANFTLSVGEVMQYISTEQMIQEINAREGRKPTEVKKLYDELRLKFNMGHFENKEDLRKSINRFLDDVNCY